MFVCDAVSPHFSPDNDAISAIHKNWHLQHVMAPILGESQPRTPCSGNGRSLGSEARTYQRDIPLSALQLRLMMFQSDSYTYGSFPMCILVPTNPLYPPYWGTFRSIYCLGLQDNLNQKVYHRAIERDIKWLMMTSALGYKEAE